MTYKYATIFQKVLCGVKVLHKHTYFMHEKQQQQYKTKNSEKKCRNCQSYFMYQIYKEMKHFFPFGPQRFSIEEVLF